MRPRARTLLVVALGASLLFVGSTMPATGEYDTVYVYEADRAGVPDGDYLVPVQDCGYPAYRTEECLVAHALATGGQLRVNASDADLPLDGEYAFVGLAEQYYRPVTEQSGETVALDLEPVPEETVKRAAARNVTDEDALAARAARTGTAETTERLPSHRTYVRYEDAYYRLRVVGTEDRPVGLTAVLPDALLGASRVLVLAAGVGVLWFGGYSYARSTD